MSTEEPTRIVVLDGHALNPGDLSWEPLRELGECAVHDRTPPELVPERAAGASIVLTNKTVLDAALIAQLPKLRCLGVLATGYDVVDVEAATERGVVVTNVPAYASDSVAQLVFAHILEHTHHVAAHSAGVHQSRWAGSEDFAYWDYPLIELAGLTMGIIGLGRIGRAVAGVARAFGMDVIAHDKIEPDETPDGVRMVDMATVFAESDVLTLHVPLTPETEGLVNADRLAMMKPTALLINASRGPLVDQEALAEALEAGRIGGAGIDVLATEPPQPDNPLIGAHGCTVTPHIGWATVAARQRLMDVAVDNVRSFLQGRPQNVVNPAP
ncbi:MAG: D-2-hydroxyacid dehydrogenase [Candidatus Brocadiia bacterium]